MSVFRLLPFSLLIAVAVSPVAAQSAPEKAPLASLSADSVPLSTRTGEHSPRLNQFGVPRVWLVNPDGQEQGDTLCYTMRSFKVARDNPQSDSTHAAGYSTCQPAARFHVHTIEGVLPPQP